MHSDYLKGQKGVLHLSRLLILMVCIVYMNILACGQNAFGGDANVDSTSDSEFIHISKVSTGEETDERASLPALVMWVALAVDGFVFLCRIFEQDDGTPETSSLIDAAFGLIYFVAFVILLVSWIKCSNKRTLFCNNTYKCYVHVLPTIGALALSVLFVFHDIRQMLTRFHSF